MRVRDLFGFLFVFVAGLGLVYAFALAPKLELCRAYYPEISSFSCVVSNYGLPARPFGGR